MQKKLRTAKTPEEIRELLTQPPDGAGFCFPRPFPGSDSVSLPEMNWFRGFVEATPIRPLRVVDPRRWAVTADNMMRRRLRSLLTRVPAF